MLGPLVLVGSGWSATLVAPWPTLIAAIFIAAVAWRIGRVRANLRKGVAGGAASRADARRDAALPGVLPDAGRRGRTRASATLVETDYAPEVLDQRRTLQGRLAGTLADIDRVAGLEDLIRAADPEPEGGPPVDAAFLIWSQTELSRLRLTSSVELFNASGVLVSRFSLKLPDVAGAQAAGEGGCEWDMFEEVSPFFAEERRLLHAGRWLCRTEPDGRRRRLGQVVVHLMLDYGNLSFVSAQSPYVALLSSGQPAGVRRGRCRSGFGRVRVERKVLYTSEGRARPLDEAALARAAASREPFWAPAVGRPGDRFVRLERPRRDLRAQHAQREAALAT